MANRYIVLGPIGAVYQVGFYTDEGKFFLAHEFFSKDLAETTAYRFNYALLAGVYDGR